MLAEATNITFQYLAVHGTFCVRAYGRLPSFFYLRLLFASRLFLNRGASLYFYLSFYLSFCLLSTMVLVRKPVRQSVVYVTCFWFVARTAMVMMSEG